MKFPGNVFVRSTFVVVCLLNLLTTAPDVLAQKKPTPLKMNGKTSLAFGGTVRMVKGVIFADVGSVSRVVVMQPSGNAAMKLRNGEALNPGQQCYIYFDGQPVAGTLVQIPWYEEGNHCRPLLSHLFVLTWGAEGEYAGSVYMCDYNEKDSAPCCQLWGDCSGVSSPRPRRLNYRSQGSLACFGGADYPASWKNQANCNAYGCNFGSMDSEACLDLGSRMGADEVVHGITGGGRSNECWLQTACSDVRAHNSFLYYRAGSAPPDPPPSVNYQNRGAFACFGGATFPESWKNEADCRGYGCNFGIKNRQDCLALGARKGAGEVIHGNAGGGRSNECWLQHSCSDLRPHDAFSLFRR